jgi:hypothetical protein
MPVLMLLHPIVWELLKVASAPTALAHKLSAVSFVWEGAGSSTVPVTCYLESDGRPLRSPALGCV